VKKALLCAGLVLAACDGTRGPLVVSLADAGARGDAAEPDAGVWSAPAEATFQLQLTGALDTSVDVDVYILDLDNEPADFATLRSAGRRTVCHFSAGSHERFRDDAGAFPEAVQGNALIDYPDERWLDVRSAAVRTAMQARLERAREHGCDAVLPTNLGVHAADSGFDLAEADARAYGSWLAAEAHARGLGAMLGSEELVAQLGADYDMGLAFGCLAGGCARWAPLREAGKTLMVVEVGDETTAATVCPAAAAAGLVAIVKNPEFDAFLVTCP
jgi:hypothetical protein